MAADGSIIIDSAIRTEGFEAGAKEIETACRRAASSVAGVGAKAQIAINKSVNAFIKQNQAVAQQQRKVEELKKEYDRLNDTEVEAEEFAHINREIDRTTAQVRKLEQRIQDFKSKGGDTSSKTFKGMEIELQRLMADLERAEADKKAILATGTAYIPADTSGISTQLQSEQQKLSNMTSSLNVSFAALQSKLGQYGAQVTSATGKTTPLNTALSRLKTSVATVANQIGGKLKQGLQSVGNLAKKAAKSFLNLGKSSKTANNGFKGGLKSLLRYGIGVESLFTLFNKMRQAVTDGIKNLAQFDSGTNESMSNMSSALTQLKNSIATAFAPILTVVAPIITQFIGMISEAATQLGIFIARLTGATSFTKAVAVQEDYAASLNTTADAAKNAQKQLSGLDEVTTWQSEKNTGGGTSVSPSQMFQTVTLESNIGSFANKIKQSIEKDDWQGVGSLFAEKLNGAIGSLDFAQAGAKVGEWIKNALNVGIGFMDTFDWQQVGQKAWQFVSSIDWNGIVSNLFRLIGSGVGAGAGILWGYIQEAWNELVKWWSDTAFEDGQFTITGLLRGIWQGIKGIGTWIKEKIFRPFIDGFKNAFGIASPSKVMHEMGTFIMQGLFNGIASMISKVAAKFGEVKTRIAEIVSNMRVEISSAWTNIKTKAVTLFNNMKTSVVDIFMRLKNAIKTPLNGIIGFVNGLIRGIVNGINSAIRALNRLSFSVPDWVPGIGGSHFGFNIREISAPQIPYLATGAVIPPNAPFTAVLGDQKHGNNLEAPEALLRQIVREESGRGGGEYRFTAQINRRTLFDEMISEGKLRQSTTGQNPFLLT